MHDRSSFILATAGHVDHGKSALVRALTGTEPDRLPAEKARGVTIELGFAHLTIGSLDVGVVDVPGHEDFVKNMVAGVGAIDLALLVVAADDGWMPQTEEHLQILTYLGVRRAIVALTKIDLVDDVSIVEGAVRRQLADSRFADAPIVCTSTKREAGVDRLTETIRATLATATPRADVGKPRLAVDRAFSLRGIGTVVTGTLVGGSIARDDVVVVKPRGATAAVRFAQKHGHDVESASPGSRVALNLPALSVCERDRSSMTDAIGRGDVVSIAGVGVVTRCIDVEVQRSARTVDATPLESGLRIVVHHGSTSAFATLRTLDRETVAGGEKAFARLKLERPMLLLIGDRLLVRDSSQRETLAGAIVLDLSPPTSRRAIAPQLALLRLRSGDASIEAAIASQVERDGRVSIDALDRSHDTSRASLLAAIDAGLARDAWRREGDLLVGIEVWNASAAAIARAVDAHHAAHPEHAGVSLTLLREATKRNQDASIFEAVVAEIAAGSEFKRVGNVLRRRGHQAALPLRLQSAGAAIRQLLDARPFDPPSRKDIARDDLSAQALRFLIANAAVVEVGPDVVMSDRAYRAAAANVVGRLRDLSAATVSELKQSLGSSRRVVVPLLERFDRDGITRRVGDRRELGPRAPV